jgi:hypothetical protein
MIISADKGHLDKSGSLGLREPHLAMHGCISTMVNYHALKVIIARRIFIHENFRTRMVVMAPLLCSSSLNFKEASC